MSIVTYLVSFVDITLFKCILTVVKLAVGVARLPLYIIWLPPTVHLTLSVSILCGRSMAIIRM